MFGCQFCKKNFSTKSSLNLHIKTAKFCLKLQNKPLEEEYTCNACNKTFSLKNHFIQHTFVCKNIKEHEEIKINDYNKQLELKINQLNKQLELIKEENTKYKTENQILEIKLSESKKTIEIYKQQINTFEQLIEKNIQVKKEEQKTISSLTSTLEKAVSTSSSMISSSNSNNTINTINSNNHITQNINLTFPLNLSEEFISKKKLLITEKHVREKQKGMADWFYKEFATNDKGEFCIICTDKNRKNFQYLSEKGITVCDAGGNIILESLNLHAKPQIYKIINRIANGEKELYEQYNNGNLFDSKFVSNLSSKVYVKNDVEKIQSNASIKEKRRIMRETGMSEEEYNLTVLKKEDQNTNEEQNENENNTYEDE